MERDNTYIRFDWAMKHMLRDKANFGILEGLISVLLKEKVTIIEVLDDEDRDNDKYYHISLKAKDSKDNLIVVEIQLVRQLHYLRRMYHGVYMPIKKFVQAKKVFSINILYCDLGRGNDYVYHGETNFRGVHTGADLVVSTKEEGVIIPHYPREVFPEYFLLRVNAYTKIPDTPLDEWMEYLKTGIVNDHPQAPGLAEVKEKLRVLSMSVEEKRAYDAHMDTIMVQNDVLDTYREEGRAEGLAIGLAEGEAKGRAEGLAEGRAEAIRSMVKSMYKRNMAVATIASLVELSETEVADILRDA